jgi:hypothetical protein
MYKRNKFRAVKTTIDNIIFDSKMESYHYLILKQLADSGKVSNLEIHPKFPIYIKNKLVCKVILDFAYDDDIGTHYIDVKGMDTPISRLKRKMVEAEYDITVEVIKVKRN